MRPSKHSRTSPVAKIPQDILLEIFIHCLPRRPLAIQLSKRCMKTAPMLLCHICSSWRRVALASPTLWSHLSYELKVWPIHEELGGWSFLQNQIEHILWWKENQGSIAPFLCFDLDKVKRDLNRKSLLAGDGMTFLMKYLSSAQYLQISEAFWELVEERLEDGYPLICPNLHTLVATDGHVGIEDAFFRAQILIGLIPNHRPSALRRLSIYKYDLPFLTNVIPNHWSLLTHLSLRYVGISLCFWFPLIRAVPNLQWAFIYFDNILDIQADLTPTDHVLPNLCTLFVGLMPVEEFEGLNAQFRPGLLLTRLHLPALRTLSLSCLKMDHDHISEIYTILQSTPALTTLTVKGYDALAKNPYRPEMHAAAQGGIAPIWARTPHLTHVQLALPCTMGCSHEDTAALLDGFVRHAFFAANSLLALDDPGCPLRTVTLIDMESATSLRFNEIENLTRECIQQRGGGRSNIAIKFVTKVEDGSFEDPETPRWKRWGVEYI